MPESLATIETTLGCSLTPVASSDEHHNTHYRGQLPSGHSVFVKVIEDEPAYYAAEVRAARHVARTGIRTPRLRDHGAIDRRYRWLAFDWHDLVSLEPTFAQIERAGETLGALHSATTGVRDPQLRQYTALDELVSDKIARVAALDPQLAARLQRLRAALVTPCSGDLDRSVCLLHGDAGWRNIKTDPAGQLWLIDLEHAAIGHPLLDFAKLWDRELDNATDRQAFLRGYQRTHPSVNLRRETIDPIRLWAAAGIIPYARAHKDSAFEQHALVILDRLDADR